jgi:hypothetical protein
MFLKKIVVSGQDEIRAVLTLWTTTVDDTAPHQPRKKRELTRAM